MPGWAPSNARTIVLYRGSNPDLLRRMLMRTAPIYSIEPAKGWIPWGLLAPVIGFILVAAPLAAVLLVLAHFQLLDAQDEPAGIFGLYAFLLLPFASIGLV